MYNQKVFVNGKINELSRKEIFQVIKAAGGKPQLILTNDTDIVISGKKNASLTLTNLKIQKQAIRNNLLVWTEEDFLSALEAELVGVAV
ncbi:hypothetical protein [Enterococcus sp. AZ103]|uniref:hypothetical protein n=1 Tax=Enterococcus sp. AZ103 TaxID=2774628 RepID=UPI003F212342